MCHIEFIEASRDNISQAFSDEILVRYCLQKVLSGLSIPVQF